MVGIPSFYVNDANDFFRFSIVNRCANLAFYLAVANIIRCIAIDGTSVLHKQSNHYEKLEYRSIRGMPVEKRP